MMNFQSPVTAGEVYRCSRPVKPRNGETYAPSRFYAIANVNKSSPTVRIDFASLTPHPQWDERTIRNDVAVFRTTEPIPFDDNVKPICIPRSGSTYPRDNEKAIAMGWGDTERFKIINFIPDNLQYAEQRVKQGPKCMYYFFGRPIDDAELCASDNFSGVCNHDSGGPLVLQNSATNNVPVQIGIASYGAVPLCGFLTPSVWFRTSYYNSFIKEAAAGDELCEI